MLGMIGEEKIQRNYKKFRSKENNDDFSTYFVYRRSISPSRVDFTKSDENSCEKDQKRDILTDELFWRQNRRRETESDDRLESSLERGKKCFQK